MSSTINWRKAEDHPKTFEHGETMLVAVGLHIRRRYGGSTFSGSLIDRVAVSRREDGNFDFLADGEPWSWEWSDATWWVPIEEIEATLPKPTKETP